MKLLTDKNVYEATKERISQIFEDFEHVLVATSGGKDSTVVLEMAVEEARRRDRLPLDAMFLDQEGEHEGTIEYMEWLVDRPDINLLWYQIPFILFNSSANPEDPWIHCFEPGEEWMRPQHPSSIHQNSLGTNRFYNVLDAIPKEQFLGKKVAVIQGMRAEESPARRLATVSTPRFRDWTWATGKVDEKNDVWQYNMRPIYDWSYRDVWTAIERFGWFYNKTYDLMFQHGERVDKMRVSNLTADDAISSLEMLQEMEHGTWEALQKRLGGIHVAAHAFDLFVVPEELPEAFSSWREYRDYLLENLISEDKQDAFKKLWRDDWVYPPEIRQYRTTYEISSILINDYHGKRLETWDVAFGKMALKRKKGKEVVEAEGAATS